MTFSKDTRILIVGLGLLGGSYAEGLTDSGYIVDAIDINKESIVYAKNKKIINEGFCLTEDAKLDTYDLIIFAMYPKVLINWLKNYQHLFKPGTLLTDVTGVKGYVVNEIDKILRNDIEFIGAHPMAGREVYGVQNSTKEMFKNANYIVTPTLKSSESHIFIVEEIGRILGFKNIVRLTVDEHDEMIGFLSQLTHCIAVSLMTCKDSANLVKYTGDSFRDLTRIAKINENMWSELFLLNKEELLSQMDIFLEQFKKLKETIETENVEEMKNIMRLSTKRRSYFDR